MKVFLPAVAAACLGSTAAAKPDLPTIPVNVDIFSDKHCNKKIDTVTLKYYESGAGGSGCADCKGAASPFASFQAHPVKGLNFTFLFANAFEVYGTAPCLAASYVNTTSVDNGPVCTQALTKKGETSHALKLEVSGP